VDVSEEEEEDEEMLCAGFEEMEAELRAMEEEKANVNN